MPVLMVDRSTLPVRFRPIPSQPDRQLADQAETPPSRCATAPFSICEIEDDFPGVSQDVIRSCFVPLTLAPGRALHTS